MVLHPAQKPLCSREGLFPQQHVLSARNPRRQPFFVGNSTRPTDLEQHECHPDAWLFSRIKVRVLAQLFLQFLAFPFVVQKDIAIIEVFAFHFLLGPSQNRPEVPQFPSPLGCLALKPLRPIRPETLLQNLILHCHELPVASRIPLPTTTPNQLPINTGRLM